jgi:hypothetical protein
MHPYTHIYTSCIHVNAAFVQNVASFSLSHTHRHTDIQNTHACMHISSTQKITTLAHNIAFLTCIPTYIHTKDVHTYTRTSSTHTSTALAHHITSLKHPRSPQHCVYSSSFLYVCVYIYIYIYTHT